MQQSTLVFRSRSVRDEWIREHKGLPNYDLVPFEYVEPSNGEPRYGIAFHPTSNGKETTS
jgi:hypothetical protein